MGKELERIKPKTEEEILLEKAYNNYFEDLLTGKAATAKDLAKRHGVTVTEIAKIMSSPNFVKSFTKYKEAMASVEFDANAYDRGIKIIQEGKDKDAVAATKVIGDLLGKNKKQSKGFQQQINVNVSEYMEKIKKENLDKIIEVSYPGFEE